MSLLHSCSIMKLACSIEALGGVLLHCSYMLIPKCFLPTNFSLMAVCGTLLFTWTDCVISSYSPTPTQRMPVFLPPIPDTFFLSIVKCNFPPTQLHLPLNSYVFIKCNPHSKSFCFLWCHPLHQLIVRPQGHWVILSRVPTVVIKDTQPPLWGER